MISVSVPGIIILILIIFALVTQVAKYHSPPNAILRKINYSDDYIFAPELTLPNICNQNIDLDIGNSQDLHKIRPTPPRGNKQIRLNLYSKAVSSITDVYPEFKKGQKYIAVFYWVFCAVIHPKTGKFVRVSNSATNNYFDKRDEEFTISGANVIFEKTMNRNSFGIISRNPVFVSKKKCYLVVYSERFGKIGDIDTGYPMTTKVFILKNNDGIPCNGYEETEDHIRFTDIIEE
jgi:hypothetical protein